MDALLDGTATWTPGLYGIPADLSGPVQNARDAARRVIRAELVQRRSTESPRADTDAARNLESAYLAWKRGGPDAQRREQAHELHAWARASCPTEGAPPFLPKSHVAKPWLAFAPQVSPAFAPKGPPRHDPRKVGELLIRLASELTLRTFQDIHALVCDLGVANTLLADALGDALDEIESEENSQ